jgi:hypothetical protein
MYFPAEIRANYDSLYMQRFNLTKSVDDKFKEKMEVINNPERYRRKLMLKQQAKKPIEE